VAAAVPTTLLFDRSDMAYKLSEYGLEAALDDNADGAEDTQTVSGSPASTPWVNRARYSGTNKVFSYLLPKYSAAELALSPIACEWGILFGCRYLLTRRGNPCPASLQADCDAAEAQMKEIAKGEAILPDAAPLATGLPSHANVRIDRNYPLGKVRVIRPESDETPADHAQRVDWPAEFGPYR
jgi:hypothetical protein